MALVYKSVYIVSGCGIRLVRSMKCRRRGASWTPSPAVLTKFVLLGPLNVFYIFKITNIVKLYIFKIYINSNTKNETTSTTVLSFNLQFNYNYKS